MTGWAEAVPAVLAAVGVLLLPGLLIAVAVGLRGVAALGLAAPLSVTTVAVTALAASSAGVSFGVVAVVVVTATGASLALVTSRLLRSPATARPDGRLTVTAGVAGAAVGGACAAAAVIRGMAQPEVFPQTFDAVFHLSAVWHILQTADGSSLTVGTVAAPGRTLAFYPAAWHDVVALVVQLSGVEAVVAANAVSLAIAAVVWPLGCVLLTRQVVGDQPAVLFAAGSLSAAFGASPYLLLSYGTLWPNALATALLPALLSCAVSVLAPGGRRPDGDPLGAGRAAVLGGAASLGVALAHPNAVPSAVLYVTVMALVSLGRWGRVASPGPRRRVLTAGAAALILGAVLWFVAGSPVFAAARGTSWPARQTLAQAAGEWLLSAPQRSPVPWLAAGLVLTGCIVAWRRPSLRWLVLAHVAGGCSFVVVAGSDGRVARALSGPWYDDPFRLAALLGVTAVPLAALGVHGLATVVLGAIGRTRAQVPSTRPVVMCMALALVVLTGGMYAGANGRVLGTWYRGQSLAGPEERQLLESLPEVVPSGVRIVGNPWNGSPLASPLGDREAVFPHLAGAWDADRALLATSLNRAEELPEVCAAARRLDAGYVIDGDIAFWKGDRRQLVYPGLEVSGHPGFEPIARGGRLTLYRVTACS